MNKSTIEVTPKTMFGYALFFMGIILLGYVAIQCFFLANGTIEPIEMEIEETQYTRGTGYLLGILLQIGMYTLLILISFILTKTGLNIARKHD
jgi:hypothetical protein